MPIRDTDLLIHSAMTILANDLILENCVSLRCGNIIARTVAGVLSYRQKLKRARNLMNAHPKEVETLWR